jgi:multiple sugar transport system permease protein
MASGRQTEDMAMAGPEPKASRPPGRHLRALSTWSERRAGSVFIWPAVLVILFLSIFPLIVSLYLSLSHFKFVKGGFQITFAGLANYRKLLVGSEKTHFLGVMGQVSPIGWLIFAAVTAVLVWGLLRYLRGGQSSPVGVFGRILASVIGLGCTWLIVHTLARDGRPGTLVVTWIYVFVDLAIQYSIGLGLALLCSQRVPGRRFFRIVFLLPMMITPVGIAYMFRMLVDTDKGPFQPIWQAAGLGLFSWVNNPWTARLAIMLGDIWQWTPFMFIVLLAALEGQSVELFEAALVDGANRWQIFWRVTFPQILPVSTTLILIRMIEAFKIVDLPNVLTNGGPGTATESLTLQAFFAWRTLDLGGSAALAYMLLVVVTFIGMSYVTLVRRRAEGV